MRPANRSGEGCGGEILVDDRLDPDELAASANDGDAATPRGNDDSAVAVRDQAADLFRCDDLDRPRGRDHAPPTPSLVVHHRPALGLLPADLILQGRVRSVRFL